MNIYLIRHGQTDWNLQGKLQGREDIELNDAGRKQAEKSALALKDTGVKFILTSPLIRAVETARIISKAIEGSEVIIEEDLIERDFGVLSGMTYDRKKYFDTFGKGEESMEPFDKLSKRLMDCILKNVNKYKGQDIIMVSHGAAINAVLSVLSGGDEGSGKTRLKNACINVLSYKEDKLNIDHINLSPEEFAQIRPTDLGITGKISEVDKEDRVDKEDKYLVSVDIGTTTLGFNLISLSEDSIVASYTCLNPQRSYGADVISRIKASNEGKQDILREIIRDEILRGLLHLINEQDTYLKSIKGVVISGNTTMIHLFMGYSCQGLGIYPYTPFDLDTIRITTDKVFDIEEKIPITILPGISAFVGGDIVAGLLACGFDKTEDICLFIDLGTNGEMAIGNKDKILVSSTAAGPAFEGINISCGLGCVPGAINHISYEDGNLSYETIENEKPLGLCGTGLIELVSELLKEGIIDNTGLFIDPYFEEGFSLAGFTFIQKDIRQLQMAKAAIRAGAEILVNKYGSSFDQLDRVYIAGSFGYHLDVKKAIRIGLLPEGILEKTQGVGNTSLSGATDLVLDLDQLKRAEHIIRSSKEIHLSNENDFSDLYIQHMMF